MAFLPRGEDEAAGDFIKRVTSTLLYSESGMSRTTTVEGRVSTLGPTLIRDCGMPLLMSHLATAIVHALLGKCVQNALSHVETRISLQPSLAALVGI